MIEDQKKELGYLVKTYGFRHQKVISVSQKLDLLIYKAMNRHRLDYKIRTKKESLY
nr:aspartyl-phosphate phosphatase Spo0E family protein [Bacillus thuringiensis]